MIYQNFEDQFCARMQETCNKNPDPSHDMLHVLRVVKNAKLLAEKEGADLDIVVPASYLHDVVYVSKADPRRAQASKLSADETKKFLLSISYPEKYIESICHAVEAHSFSANIATKSLESKIVQDADRLDALGAIGIARCFSFSGMALRSIYSENDPFAQDRELDDSTNTLDHFYVKLLRLPEKMQTPSGREEASRRVGLMNKFLDSLKQEIC